MSTGTILDDVSGLPFVLATLLLVALAPGASPAAASCPFPIPIDWTEVIASATLGSLPFQFPLADRSLLSSEEPVRTPFATEGRTTRGQEHHAAEDYAQLPGAPVSAMADGRVSFSGRMGGYGWLVIVDHPHLNLYSLYGHLSPSRWRISPGPVVKGELIGHIGDSDENGGSEELPMFPHLHLGVRAGQRSDYPGKGQWRWMAGWIKPCPQDLGWLQPSMVIASQYVPPGGFTSPRGDLLAKWGMELILGGIYGVGAACILVFAIRRNKIPLLFLTGGALFVVAWIMEVKGMQVGPVLFGLACLFAGIGAFRLLRLRSP